MSKESDLITLDEIVKLGIKAKESIIKDKNAYMKNVVMLYNSSKILFESLKE